MKVVLTLSEVLQRCEDWEKFCDDHGYNVWAIAEGFGDAEIELSEKKAAKYGIIRLSRKISKCDE